MAKFVDFRSTSTVDFSALAGRMPEIARKVLTTHQDRILTAIRARWTGWKYAGRPPGAPRHVSRRAWKSRIESTSPAKLAITNEARDYRTGTRAYVRYVHRAGTRKLEVQVVQADLNFKYYPAMKADLLAAIRAALVVPGKPVTARSRGSSAPTRGGGLVG